MHQAPSASRRLGEYLVRERAAHDLVRRLPHILSLKPRGRNPNGLLGFVFSDGHPESMARFIARQTRIPHAVGSGGVSVAWAIDARNRRIHTHDNAVSILPLVIVAARAVYPGLEFLDSLLERTDLTGAEPAKGDRAAAGAHDVFTSPPAVWRAPPADAAARTPTELHGAGPERIHILFLAANLAGKGEVA